MKYALILFMHLQGGTSAYSIPMETWALCQQNKKAILAELATCMTCSVDVRKATCIKVKK